MALVALVLGLPQIQSTWSMWFWAAAAILFFYRSALLYGEIEKQKAARPTPTVTLLDTIKRIRGTENIFGIDNVDSLKVQDAFTAIREKAKNQEIVVFGRKEWRKVPMNNLDLAPRVPIEADFWDNNRIDYMAFISDLRGMTENMVTSAPLDGIFELWFDQRQIDSVWPPPKKSFRQLLKSKL